MNTKITREYFLYKKLRVGIFTRVKITLMNTGQDLIRYIQEIFHKKLTKQKKDNFHRDHLNPIKLSIW